MKQQYELHQQLLATQKKVEQSRLVVEQARIHVTEADSLMIARIHHLLHSDAIHQCLKNELNAREDSLRSLHIGMLEGSMNSELYSIFLGHVEEAEMYLTRRTLEILQADGEYQNLKTSTLSLDWTFKKQVGLLEMDEFELRECERALEEHRVELLQDFTSRLPTRRASEMKQ